MKTIFKTSFALLAGAVLFSACDKDMDDNPILQAPTTFTLNTPDFASGVVDLATSEPLEFTWEQPAYGFNAAATYGMQFSTRNVWVLEAGSVSNSSSTKADYAKVGNEVQTLSATVAPADLAFAIQKMERYASASVPATQDVYARTYSVLGRDTIFSEPVKLQVKPYFVLLENAPIKTWYLIGDGVGPTGWSSTIPLLPKGGETYDPVTGQGVISWTGYLTTGGFKVRENAANWDGGQWGQGAAFGTFEKQTGGDIHVPSAGYYTVTLDTKNDVFTVVPYSGTAPTTEYTSMALPGSYGSWSPTADGVMTAQGAAGHNHDWKTTITVANDDSECKFAANGTWDVKSWGGTKFPYGTSDTGDNIKHVAKGTYDVFFNDITGQYSFVKQ